MNVMILAAEGPNGWFIPSDPKELYFGAAAFAIVFGLMAWKLFPIIGRALGNRGTRIADELAAAEQAQAEADAEVAALKARLGDVEADARKLVADAQEQAERMKADAADRARVDAEALRERAEADIDAMRAQAAVDLEAELSLAALQVAEEVVAANLDDATQAQLIEQYIDQVGAS